VYNGPSAQVDIAQTRQRATRGVPIDVVSDVASVLLAQSVWDPADPGSGGTVQVLVQGQTLVVTAATLDGGAVTLYSDDETTTEVTLPATLTTDTTWYLALDTTGTLALAVSWPGGTALDPVTGTVRNGKALILRPYPTTAQLVSAASAFGGSGVDGGTP
jgi:hypothetical protein